MRSFDVEVVLTDRYELQVEADSEEEAQAMVENDLEELVAAENGPSERDIQIFVR